MENMIRPEEKRALSVLDGLAAQARMFRQNAEMNLAGLTMNLLQLGRVFTEAKPLVPHGEWASWIDENTSLSVRTAEQYMQAYSEFGLDPDIAALGTTKVAKLLPLPEDRRREFMEKNDVRSMSTRELDRALKEEREKMQEEMRVREETIRKEAEEQSRNSTQELRKEYERELEESRKQVRELMDRPPVIPEEVVETLKEREETIRKQKEEIQREKESLEAAINHARELNQKNAGMSNELEEANAMLQELQENLDRVQGEYLDLQSAISRGDADRVPGDQLTADVFATAVRSFIGSVARMPQMGTSFAMMDPENIRSFEESLATVEAWANGARKALNTVDGGGRIE